MVLRSECLCEGKIIGIETIYTVVNGKQINIPEKLEGLRTKSHENMLFCPCGCGANLILVAGDRYLKKQHFRIKESRCKEYCEYISEGKISVDSKIVLKCWLDDKLCTDDIETRVPISDITDRKRKYEFTFLSKVKKIALSYNFKRTNISNEKLEILEGNNLDIKVIYILDSSNQDCNGQYPEHLMKIQNIQGYCLFLEIHDSEYSNAKLRATYYKKDIDGIWKELEITTGYLNQYVISGEGVIAQNDEALEIKRDRIISEFDCKVEKERKKRTELAEKKAEEQRKRIKELKQIEEQNRLRKIDFEKNMREGLIQQDTQVIDEYGNRWIRCEHCGKCDLEKEFTSFGGLKRINLGTCRECSRKQAVENKSVSVNNKGVSSEFKKSSRSGIYVCPMCSGELKERRGPYGIFLGCVNYPKCTFKQKLKKR